ncbi:MAG TPA: response regulator [Bacteroidales bacterium]|nr:response regulator [Bacteroidales bacterium]HRZ49048.1 response regulator [Bacteroidales bacterium]
MGKLRILIVEDEFLVAADIEESLVQMGYEVQGCVASGQAALDEVDRCLPDLILMDIRLKGEMTGIEAAKKILQTHDVPIIYLTANADLGTIELAKVSLPYGYITKPYNEKDLRTNIEIARYKFESDIQMKVASDQFHSFFKAGSPTHVVMDADTGLIREKQDNIYYIEEEDSGSKLHLRDESYSIATPLDTVKTLLPEDLFVRINERCIINKGKIFRIMLPDIILKDVMVVLPIDADKFKLFE